MLSFSSIAAKEISASDYAWTTATSDAVTVTISAGRSDRDWVSINLTSHESGLAGAVNIIDNVSLVLSTSDHGTNLGVDDITVTVETRDSGSAAFHGADNFDIGLSTVDIGKVTLRGTDVATISVDFAESDSGRIRVGSDSADVGLSTSEHGWIPSSGIDRATVTISLSEDGRVTVASNTTGNAVVVNLTTAGHATYTNYGFNSYFRLGNDYYGCAATGIYKLSGAKDVTTAIASSVTTGVSDFGNKTFIHDAYLLVRTPGEMTLQTITEENSKVDPYPVINSGDMDGLRRQRIKLAKGVKGNTWQFKIENVDGADFMLRSLEVLPIQSQRVSG